MVLGFEAMIKEGPDRYSVSRYGVEKARDAKGIGKSWSLKDETGRNSTLNIKDREKSVVFNVAETSREVQFNNKTNNKHWFCKCEGHW